MSPPTNDQLLMSPPPLPKKSNKKLPLKRALKKTLLGAAHLNKEKAAAILAFGNPSESSLTDKAADGPSGSFTQGSTADVMGMGDVAASLPSDAKDKSGNTSTIAEDDSNAITNRENSPLNASSVVLPNSTPISPPNPFRTGQVRIKHNMSFEPKKPNTSREALVSEPPTVHHSSPTPMRRRTTSVDSTSSYISSDSSSADWFAASNSVNSPAKGPQRIETIYNPAAHTTPIRIYVVGRDPDYVEPKPLQWKPTSAMKWEQEKAKFVKRGAEKIAEFGGVSDRTCVYYWEWVNRGPDKEKICQWILFREKLEGRSHKKVDREAL